MWRSYSHGLACCGDVLYCACAIAALSLIACQLISDSMIPFCLYSSLNSVIAFFFLFSLQISLLCFRCCAYQACWLWLQFKHKPLPFCYIHFSKNLDPISMLPYHLACVIQFIIQILGEITTFPNIVSFSLYTYLHIFYTDFPL